MSSKKYTSHSWRKFEQLICSIEKSLCPKGAIVKSPDFLPDKITGTLREVDISINYSIGLTSILIIIECRDRSKIQDVTWIEQIATKQRDVGASKAIAVTAKGVSKAAMKKATHYDIELRRLQNIKLEHIDKWITQEHRHYKLLNYHFVTNHVDDNKEYIPLRELTVTDYKGDKILVDHILYELWDTAMNDKGFKTRKAPVNPEQILHLQVPLPPKTYYFKNSVGLSEWLLVQFNYLLETTRELVKNDMFAYSYTNDVTAIGFPFAISEFPDRELFHRQYDLHDLKSDEWIKLHH